MFRSAWLPLLWLAFATGCGNGLAGVSGQVTLAGKPLTNGTVTFKHEATGLVTYGVIDREGRYRLKTGDKAGVSAGAYRAAVMSYADVPVSASSKGPPPARPLGIPKRYTRHETSGLTFNVAAGSSTVCDILLEAE